MKITLELTEFAPDQPARSGLLMEANNVYPKVNGYGSFGGFSGFSDALPATFKGGGSFIAKDGTSSLLVGTASGLVKYGGGTWTVLTGLIQAPVANAPTTSTAGGTLAAATYYYKITALNALGETIGSNEVSVTTTGATSSNTVTWGAVATATGYRIYRGTAAAGENTYYAVGTVTTFTDTGAAGTAGTVPGANTTGMTVGGQWRFAQFGNYVVAVNGVETKVVDLVASTASTLTDAPAGTCVAIVGDYVVIGQGSNDLLGITTSAEGSHTDWDVAKTTATYQPMLAGGEVMGLASGEFGVILQRGRLVRMSRTGDATVPFQYDVINENIGCASKGSVQQFGNMVFFLSDSGFKMLVSGQELKAIGSEKVDRTFASAVPRDDWAKMFSAVDPQSKTVIWCVPGVPGKLWIYNWELDRWSTGSLNIEAVMAGFTSSIDLEALAVTYPNLDAMTISLDDPRWSGGNPRLYAVNGGVLGTFFGATLQATFGYGFVELTPGAVARVRSLRPLIDADKGQTVRVDSYARMTDAVDSSSTAELRPSGIMPVRCSGRYVRPRWTIDAGTNWSFAQGLEVDYEVGGGR